MERPCGVPLCVPLDKHWTASGVILFGHQVASSNRSQEITEAAIAAGYRHLDTAHCYQVEDELGKALRSKIQQGIIRREDMFVVSKVSQSYQQLSLLQLLLLKRHVSKTP